MIGPIPGAAAFLASTQGAPTGLTGTIGVQVVGPGASTVALARVTAGIVEYPAGSGIYAASLIAPTNSGIYNVIWDTGGAAPVFFIEQILVNPGAVYAFGSPTPYVHIWS